jgi:hypothetical protein
MKAKETDHKILRFLIRKFLRVYHLHKNVPPRPHKKMLRVKVTGEGTSTVRFGDEV